MDCKVNLTFLPIKVAYFFFMAAFSCMIPYLPVFYTQMGMLVWQVGILRGLEPVVVFIFSPFWGAFADKHSKHRIALLVAIAGTGIFYFLIFFVPLFANTVTTDVTVLRNATQCNLLDLHVVPSLQCKTDISFRRVKNGKGSAECNVICDGIMNLDGANLEHLRTCSMGTEFWNCATCDQKISNQSEKMFVGIMTCDWNSSEQAPYLPMQGPIVVAEQNCELQSCCQCLVETGVPTSQKLSLMFALSLSLSMISVFFNCNILPFLDSILMELLGDNHRDYGKHRLWGAVGWGICAFVSGAAIDFYTSLTNSPEQRYEPLFVIYLLMTGVTWLVVANMTFPVHQTPQKMQKNLLLLAKRPEVIMFLVVIVIEGISFGMSFSHVLIFLKIELGASHTLLGLSILATCVAETPLLFLSGWVVKHIGYKGVIYLTLIAYALRYLGYALLQNAWWVLAVQLLHGITFGIGWPGFTAYANSIAPKGMAATLQAIMAGTYIGVGTAIGNILGGFLYELFGFRWLFAGNAVLCLITAVVYFVVDWTIVAKMYSPTAATKNVELQDTEAGGKEETKSIANGKGSVAPEMDEMLENSHQEDK